MKVFILDNKNKKFFCDIRLISNSMEEFEKRLMKKLIKLDIENVLLLCVPMNFFDVGIFDKDEVLMWDKNSKMLK